MKLDRGTILLTGVSGYIGSRLLPELVRLGRPIRCLTRRPARLPSRAEHVTEVVRGDVLDAATLPAAMAGVDTAYYLVHSMGAGKGFEARDRQAAANFARAARQAGVRRIVYLGGLGSEEDALSSHLRSRQETGRVLAESGAQVIEFRASVVIGAGSLSFELVRALVERLPAMICPRWVRTLAQPIAVADALRYLLAALDLPAGPGHVIEIGGADQVSYADIMREYARQRGLRRPMIPVPVLTPWLSSLWLALVTPVFARVGRQLIEGVRNPTVVRDDRARSLFGFEPMGLRAAIREALAEEEARFQAPYSDLLREAFGQEVARRHVRVGTRILDTRSVWVDRSPRQAFAPIRRIGGRTGWYYGDWLWSVRGLLDRMVGGPGMRRTLRREGDGPPRVGERIDCWRVEVCEADRRLRLAAEMRLPGRAWLELEVRPEGTGARIRQTAVFEPRGTFGRAYWTLLLTLHVILFDGMLREIALRARSTGS